MASIHTFKYDEEQIYLMRYSGMVHGNNFYRPWFAEKTGAKPYGEDIDLDVSDLRDGLPPFSCLPPFKRKEHINPGMRLYLVYLHGRIFQRNALKKAQCLPLGLQ